MSINFKGASNFTITGGNFGNIEGNILNVHIPQSLGYEQVDPPSLSSSRSRRTTSVRPSRRSEKQRSQHRVKDTRRPLLLAPPEPAATTPAAAPATAAVASPESTIQFPAVTCSSPADLDIQEDGGGNDSDSSGTSGYERYLTPPSDMERNLEDESGGSSNIVLCPSPPTFTQSATMASLPQSIVSAQHYYPSVQTHTYLRGIDHTGRTVSESIYSRRVYGSDPSPDIVPHPRAPRSFTVPLPALGPSTIQPIHETVHHTHTTHGHYDHRPSPNQPGGGSLQRAPHRSQTDNAHGARECNHEHRPFLLPSGCPPSHHP
ncbi:hypothetical protein P691DRAFT_358474 [Macrolepiota fuliginosa MF-IS2]|uniref:Uncharacterized protein n=1 Tax=Macrolepiota fuliginosa MF-IS2 TaxID=1400762 RepID=A0A9P5X6B6_9AGAR|nr:hypothetical protein P691DRAFT_358474 [Macrolepiota fuliginosa MF-IS2]